MHKAKELEMGETEPGVKSWMQTIERNANPCTHNFYCVGFFSSGKLFDVTGSYDVPFYINGALLWLAALMMAFVTKCSKWKPVHYATTTQGPSEDYRVIEDTGNGSISRDTSKEPIKTGYQPVPNSAEVEEQQSEV